MKKLWDHTPNPDYLSHPSNGSPHARGAAIDLTLIEEGDAELDMGTQFDAMTSLSHHGALEISAEAQKKTGRFYLVSCQRPGGIFYGNEMVALSVIQA